MSKPGLDVVHFRQPHASGLLCKASPGGFFVSDQDVGTPRITCERCLELLYLLAERELLVEIASEPEKP